MPPLPQRPQGFIVKNMNSLEICRRSGLSEERIQDILETGRELWEKAEPGFRENRTHEYLTRRFDELNFKITPFSGMPGFIAEPPDTSASSGREFPAQSRPRIALIADMDGLPNPGNPGGNYIHSCGHHMQMANIYGAARILSERKSPALARLSFIAAPAEEYIDLDKREELRREGKISQLSGKQELLDRKLLKQFSHVVSTHGAAHPQPMYIGSVRRMSGFQVMNFHFKGQAAHAGAAPHKGINAQNAASLFLQACAFLRESFEESQHIRIHPVLRLAEGQSVNIIPDTAFVETYVRGVSPEAISLTTEKLKDAAQGAAQALGASVETEITRGYAPFIVNSQMHEILRTVVEEMGVPFIDEEFGAASSDMGDISQEIPSIMLGLPGANGLFHNPNFRILDEAAAYLLPSVVLARYLEELCKEL